MAKKQNFIYAVGKRKTATARVRLFKGKGENLINGQSFEKYFPGQANKVLWIKPFEMTNTVGKYYVSAKVEGSGKMAQLDALILGAARAISKADTDNFKLPLKKAGLLTRDARERQRRMVGTGGKARRKKQSPKR